MKLIKFILILVLMIPSVNAGINIDGTSNNANSGYRINSSTFNNLTNQLIINVPYQVVSGVSYIDAITLQICSDTINAPNQDISFRIYSTANNIWSNPNDFNTFISLHLPYTTFTECGGYYKINFGSNMYITPENNESISIGVYSNSTAGYYYIFGRPDNIMLYASHHSYYPHVLNVYGQNIYGAESPQQEQILFSNAYNVIWGGLIFPTTPIPTPIESGNGTSELPCYNCNGTFPSLNNNSDTGWQPNFNDSSIPCPECIGNESINPYDSIPSGSSSEGFLKAFGYCTSLGCTIDDIISFIYDITIFMMYLSFIVVIGKWWFIWRKS